MPISVPFTGGCACGAIRYECTAEPMFSRNCHCRDCQRTTGSAYLALLSVPATAFRLEGEPRFADTEADSGNTVSRGFCSACGSPVLGKASLFPDLVSVVAGSLDDPSGFQPAADLFTARAQPWDAMNPDLMKCETMPTEEQIQMLLEG